jgi:hypothetical protein
LSEATTKITKLVEGVPFAETHERGGASGLKSEQAQL